MITVLLLLNCLFAAAVFILLGALVEQFRQIQQIRLHLDMFDAPNPLDLGLAQGLKASSVGLPTDLDRVNRSVVLFLSNKCQTCFDIAGTLAGGALPPRLWLVVVPVSGDASEFIERFHLVGDRIVTDSDGRIVESIGNDITPAAITVEAGRLERAQTVPTARQLTVLLDKVGEPAGEPPDRGRSDHDRSASDATAL